MDRRQFNGILASTLLLKLGWRDPADLPSCPSGFRWIRSDVLEAFVPCPLGWYFHEIDHDASKTALISKEDFRQNELFEIGFHINVMHDLPGDIATWCEKIVERIEAMDTVVERFKSSGSTFFMRGVEVLSIGKSPEENADDTKSIDAAFA